MASEKAYMQYILEQLAPLGQDVAVRSMMGEYILYCRGKVVGGVYDDRLLVKCTKSARRMMPEAREELPYEGAKPLLLVDNVDDAAFLCALLEAVSDEVPAPRKK